MLESETGFEPVYHGFADRGLNLLATHSMIRMAGLEPAALRAGIRSTY